MNIQTGAINQNAPHLIYSRQKNDSKSTTKMKETWELMDREQQRLVLFGKSFSDITDVPPNTAYK